MQYTRMLPTVCKPTVLTRCLQATLSLSVAAAFLCLTLLVEQSCSAQSSFKPPQQQQKVSAALVTAVKNEQAKALKTLVKQGADVNAKDAHGDTVLILAAGNGNNKIVQFLLDHGARVNARGRMGDTALIAAAISVHAGTVELLLNKGADPGLKNDSAQTALQWATLNAFDQEPISATVKALVRKGADVNASDEDGMFPLFCAALWGHEKIVSLLLSVRSEHQRKDKDRSDRVDAIGQRRNGPDHETLTPSKSGFCTKEWRGQDGVRFGGRLRQF